MDKNSKKQKPQKRNEAHNQGAQYTTIATKMALTIAAGAFGGRKLDEYFELEKAVFTIILSLLGIGLAMYIIFKDTAPKK